MSLFQPKIGKVSGGIGKPQFRLDYETSFFTLNLLSWTLQEEHEKIYYVAEKNVAGEYIEESKAFAGFRYKAVINLTTTAISSYFMLWMSLAPLEFKPHADASASYTVYIENSFAPKPIRWIKESPNVQLCIEIKGIDLIQEIFFKEY